MDDMSNLSSDEDGEEKSEAAAGQSGVAKANEGSSPELEKKRTGTTSASGTSSVASSNKKKRLKSLVEEQEIAFMESMIKRNETKVAASAMSERERHNRRMEDIEESKAKWRTKQDELAYKRELINTEYQTSSGTGRFFK
eukprot:scaffold25765_cov159-Amphora_coffeaeformis.AAC.1